MIELEENIKQYDISDFTLKIDSDIRMTLDALYGNKLEAEKHM